MNFCMFCQRTFQKSLYNIYSTDGGIFPFKDLITLLGNIDIAGEKKICVLCLTVIRIISNYRKLLLQIAMSEIVPESEEVVAAFEGFLNLLRSVPYSVNTDEEIFERSNENMIYLNYFMESRDSELTSTLYSEPVTDDTREIQTKKKKIARKKRKSKYSNSDTVYPRSKSSASIATRFSERLASSTLIYGNNCLINKRTRRMGKLQQEAAASLTSQSIIYQCQISVCYQEYESLDQLKGHLLSDHVATLDDVDRIDYNEWLEEYYGKGRLKEKFPLKNKYPCFANSCRKRCATLNDLVQHKINDHHLLACYFCKECNLTFTCETDLQFHKEKLHSEITTLCIFCSEHLHNDYQLYEHLESHRIYSIPCKYCDKYFLDYSTLSYHNKIHEADKTSVKIKRGRAFTILQRTDTFIPFDDYDGDGDENNGEFCRIREQQGPGEDFDYFLIRQEDQTNNNQEYVMRIQGNFRGNCENIDKFIEQEGNKNKKRMTRIDVEEIVSSHDTKDTSQNFGMVEAINKVINELNVEEYINSENLSIVDETIISDELTTEKNIRKLNPVQNEGVKGNIEKGALQSCSNTNKSEINTEEDAKGSNKQVSLRKKGFSVDEILNKYVSPEKTLVGHEDSSRDAIEKLDTNAKSESTNANSTHKEGSNKQAFLKICKQKQAIVILEDISPIIHLYKERIATESNINKSDEKQESSRSLIEEPVDTYAKSRVVTSNLSDAENSIGKLEIVTKNISRKRRLLANDSKEAQVTDDKSVQAESKAGVKKGRLNDFCEGIEVKSVNSDKQYNSPGICRNDVSASTSFKLRKQTKDLNDTRNVDVIEEIPELGRNAFSEKPKIKMKSLRLSKIVKRLIEEKTKKNSTSTLIYDNNCLINKRTRRVGKLKQEAAALLTSQSIIYRCQISVCYQEYESLDQLKGHLISDHVATLDHVDTIDYNEWLEEYYGKGRLKEKFPLKNKYPCFANSCRKRCATLNDLVQHKINDHHLLACYFCKECNLTFTCETDLQFHKEKLHSEITTLCIFCSEHLHNDYQLYEHLESHRIYSIPCKYCDKYFLDYSTLSYHNKIHEADKTSVEIKRGRAFTILQRTDTLIPFDDYDSDGDENNGEFCRIREQQGPGEDFDYFLIRQEDQTNNNQEYVMRIHGNFRGNCENIDKFIEQEGNKIKKRMTRIDVEEIVSSHDTKDTSQDFGMVEGINKVINELNVEEYINSENLSIVDETIISDELTTEKNIRKVNPVQNEGVKGNIEKAALKSCLNTNKSEINTEEDAKGSNKLVSLRKKGFSIDEILNKYVSSEKTLEGREDSSRDAIEKLDTNAKSESTNANSTYKEGSNKQAFLKICKQKQAIVILEHISPIIHLYKERIATESNINKSDEKQESSRSIIEEPVDSYAKSRVVTSNLSDAENSSGKLEIVTKNISRKRRLLANDSKEAQATDDKSVQAESKAGVKKGRSNDTDFCEGIEVKSVNSDKQYNSPGICRNDVSASTSFKLRKQTKDLNDTRNVDVIEEIPELGRNAFSEKPKLKMKSLRLSKIVKRLIEEKPKK